MSCPTCPRSPATTRPAPAAGSTTCSESATTEEGATAPGQPDAAAAANQDLMGYLFGS